MKNYKDIINEKCSFKFEYSDSKKYSLVNEEMKLKISVAEERDEFTLIGLQNLSDMDTYLKPSEGLDKLLVTKDINYLITYINMFI